MNNNYLIRHLLTICLLLFVETSFAQHLKRFEVGIDASYDFIACYSKSSSKFTYSSRGLNVDLFAGYKISPHFSAGAGINYLLSASEGYTGTNATNSFSAFVYGHIMILPYFRWSPFVDLRGGYCFLRKPGDGIKSHFYSAIVGASADIGKRGLKLNFGVYTELRPTQYKVAFQGNPTMKLLVYSVGPIIGIRF